MSRTSQISASCSLSLYPALVRLMRPCAFTVCTSCSAAICMNHLKRLAGGGGGGGVWLASAQLDEVADFVCVYARAVDSGMGTMSAKHVALAINALVPSYQVGGVCVCVYVCVRVCVYVCVCVYVYVMERECV